MSRFLQAYAQYVSKTTDAPQIFGHAAGLSCLSTIALGRRWLNRGSGIKPNVFMMLTADSSKDRKSTSVDLAINLLREVDEDRVGPKDFTSEGLISLMRVRKVGKARSKLIIPISEFGRYLAAAKSYAASTSAMLCDLYDGEDYERVRSGKRPLIVEKPRVSMLAAVAYGMLEKFADPNDWVTGFFARIVWIMPEEDPNRVRYHSQPPKPTSERDLAKASLLDLVDELKKTGAMTVSSQADTDYSNFAQSFATNDYGDPVLAAQRERLLNTVWKLAMLYQIDENPSQPISAQSMGFAIWFAQKAWTSFHKIYGKTAGTSFSKLCSKIHLRVHQGGPGGTYRRDVYRGLHMQAEHFDRAMDVLIKNGALECSGAGKSILLRSIADPI